MGSQGPSRRPFCAACTKPARLCLCARLRSPPLDNHIAVTILQHSSEAQHPLNSTRVARLGLRNLAVVPVTDVNFYSHFHIHPLDAQSHDFDAARKESFRDFGSLCSSSDRKKDAHVESRGEETLNFDATQTEIFRDFKKDAQLESYGREGLDFDAANQEIFLDFGRKVAEIASPCSSSTDRKRDAQLESRGEEKLVFDATQMEIFRDFKEDSQVASYGRERLDFDAIQMEISEDFDQRVADIDDIGGILPFAEDCVVKCMDKCKVICSCSDIKITIQRSVKPNLDWLLDTPIGRKAIMDGFIVMKLQAKKSWDGEVIKEFEEFAIRIPPHSALLFPCGRSIGLSSVGFEVKHLVVLDGTWAKARRMYHENPWLKLLPHLKVDSGEQSLYSEVRHEPKADCLSTVESIVFALKRLGDDMEGLDGLLDVFESMILDQRRCKDEKFRLLASAMTDNCMNNSNNNQQSHES